MLRMTTTLMLALTLAGAVGCSETTQSSHRTTSGAAGQNGDSIGQKGNASQGGFSLTVPEEAKDLIDKVKIIVFNAKNEEVEQVTKDVKGGDTVAFKLNEGVYKVLIEAFKDDTIVMTGKGETKVAAGTKSVLDVTMMETGKEDDGSGELEIRMKLPSMEDPTAPQPTPAPQEPTKPDEASPAPTPGTATAPQAGATLDSIVGTWETSYRLDGCDKAVIVAKDSGDMTISCDSKRANNTPITVKYTYEKGVLTMKDMKADNERHLARVVKANLNRSIDIRKQGDDSLTADILMAHGRTIRVKTFARVK